MFGQRIPKSWSQSAIPAYMVLKGYVCIEKYPFDWQSKTSVLTRSLIPKPNASLVRKLDQGERFFFLGCRWPDPRITARWMAFFTPFPLNMPKSWTACDPDGDNSFYHGRSASKQNKKSLCVCTYSYPATIHLFVKAAQSESLPSIK